MMMNTTIYILLLWLLPTLLLAQLPPAPHVRALVITHVTVIDATGTSAKPDMTVVVTGDRITAVGKSGRVRIPKEAEVVDATGQFLIPGLWDMHIHLTITPDQAVSRNVIMPMLVAYGITGVRDMGGDWRRIQQLRKEIAGGQLIEPQILSPGPFVDGPQPPDVNVWPVNGETEARQAVRKLKAQGVDFIKVQAGLGRADYLAVVDEAKKIGIPVYGHVPEAVSALDVVQIGQQSIEHISPVLPGDAGILLACSGQEQELRKELLDLKRAAEQEKPDMKKLRARQRQWQSQLFSTFSQVKCNELLSRFVMNQTWVVPTMIWSKAILPLSQDDRPIDPALKLIPRSLRERWQKRRTEVIRSSVSEDFAFRKLLFEKSRDFVGAMVQAKVLMMAGTDAMDGYVLPGLSLHQELVLLVQAGMTPMEAIQAATLNPARFLGEQDLRGTIKKGKIADLVLLGADPLENISNTQKIEAVVIGGKLISKSARQELLSKIEAFAGKH